MRFSRFVVDCYRCSAFVLNYVKERPTLFRRYVTLHGLALCAAFALAAVWIIISAARHSAATDTCVNDFFTENSLLDQGQTLCEIFSWEDVGLMAGLWVLLAIFQVRSAYHQMKKVPLLIACFRVIFSWSCRLIQVLNSEITYISKISVTLPIL